VNQQLKLPWVLLHSAKAPDLAGTATSTPFEFIPHELIAA
jgi:hypothetical protein